MCVNTNQADMLILQVHATEYTRHFSLILQTIFRRTLLNKEIDIQTPLSRLEGKVYTEQACF